MKRLNLAPVRVTKSDSCLTYVLKRAGYSPLPFQEAKDIPKKFYETYEIENLKVGDILVWKYEKTHYLWATEIDTLTDGKPAIVHNNEFAGLHFGIVEHIEYIDDTPVITISDCVRNNNAHSFPTIGLATICLRNEASSKTEVKRPTFILDI